MTRDQNSWKTKVHSAFVEIAELRRELVAAQKEPIPRRNEAVQRVVEAAAQKRYELLSRYPELSPGQPWGPVKTAGYKYPSPQEKQLRVFEWYFFKRFRYPLAMALQRERTGDLDAHEHLARARSEFWKKGHGYRVPQFKVNEIHSDLMEPGFGLGITELSAEELADCFDSVCPCGKLHDAEAMKKQRGRVLKQLRAALEETWRLTPTRERYAVYGTRGYIAKPYRPVHGKPYVEISRRGKGLEYIVAKGEIAGYSDQSEFDSVEVFSYLPRCFFLRSTDEIFEMFFQNR